MRRFSARDVFTQGLPQKFVAPDGRADYVASMPVYKDAFIESLDAKIRTECPQLSDRLVRHLLITAATDSGVRENYAVSLLSRLRMRSKDPEFPAEHRSAMRQNVEILIKAAKSK